VPRDEKQFNTLSARANLWHFVGMPSPTSPRKQSLMPSAPLRRTLRSAGHALDPVVHIGKQGVTESVVAQVTRALFDHELIKLKLGAECPASRFEVAERLGGEPGVQVAQILGRTILLYKRHPQDPQFEQGKSSGERKPKVQRRSRRSKVDRRSRAKRKPQAERRAESTRRSESDPRPGSDRKPASTRRPASDQRPESTGRLRRKR